MLILSPEERTNEIVQSLEKLSTKASIQIFNIDQEGVQVLKTRKITSDFSRFNPRMFPWNNNYDLLSSKH